MPLLVMVVPLPPGPTARPRGSTTCAGASALGMRQDQHLGRHPG